MEVTEPSTNEDFEKYYKLRWEVLRKPWNNPPGSEVDEMDFLSIHACIKNDKEEIVGVGRLHFNDPLEAQIRYMAVHPDYQGRNIGGKILGYLEQKAKEKGVEKLEGLRRILSDSWFSPGGNSLKRIVPQT